MAAANDKLGLPSVLAVNALARSWPLCCVRHARLKCFLDLVDVTETSYTRLRKRGDTTGVTGASRPRERFEA
jgi:hypothetical protein